MFKYVQSNSQKKLLYAVFIVNFEQIGVLL